MNEKLTIKGIVLNKGLNVEVKLLTKNGFNNLSEQISFKGKIMYIGSENTFSRGVIYKSKTVINEVVDSGKEHFKLAYLDEDGKLKSINISENMVADLKVIDFPIDLNSLLNLYCKTWEKRLKLSKEVYDLILDIEEEEETLINTKIELESYKF